MMIWLYYNYSNITVVLMLSEVDFLKVDCLRKTLLRVFLRSFNSLLCFYPCNILELWRPYKLILFVIWVRFVICLIKFWSKTFRISYIKGMTNFVQIVFCFLFTSRYLFRKFFSVFSNLILFYYVFVSYFSLFFTVLVFHQCLYNL